MENLSNTKKRIFRVLIVILIGWFALLSRLFVIQIKDPRNYSAHEIDLIEKSVQQRKQEFILSSGRGNIYDHNLESLLEKEEIDTVIIFPFIKGIFVSDKIELLAKALNIDKEELINQINQVKEPTYITQNGSPVEIASNQKFIIEQLQIPGIAATTYTIQDHNSIIAKHVIGYLGQAPTEIESEYKDYLERGIIEKDSKIGRSGLQWSFQEILMGVGEAKIAYFVDNKGIPLNGLGSKYLKSDDPYYPLSLVTTIDKQIQSFAEFHLKKNNIQEGSVVILDVQNGDILAMASAPDFDLLDVDPNTHNWNNKAVQAIEPGSVFKTVIAVAGLEEGIVSLNEKFYCIGKYELYHLTCSKEHEEITFEEGYAQSCNIVFAEVAERLGPKKIEEYAQKLGVTGTVGWEGDFFKEELFNQIANEETSRVFHTNTNKKDTGSIIRTAIGQQDVRISPLVVANLMVTILNDGRVYEPRLVEKVIYKNGTDYYDFSTHYSKEKIGSKRTYQQLRMLMEKVVDEGTGKILQQAKWNLAGKSGTAETNNNLNHQWFIGYGPTEDPLYVVAVVVKNVSTYEPLAKKVLMGIMDDLAEK